MSVFFTFFMEAENKVPSLFVHAVSVVIDTWGATPQLRVRYYSNLTNTSLGTVDIGIPNTPSGVYLQRTASFIRSLLCV